MAARPIGEYRQLYVTWTSPGGAWSVLRLIRNAFGTPVSEVDGVILIDSNSGPSATGTVDPSVRSYLDSDLEGGRFQYYAIFLLSTATGEWVRAAYTTGLPLKDYGYSNRLWELTPAVLQTKTTGLLDADNEELRSFEQVFAFQLDHIRAEYDSLVSINDPMTVSGGLLPVMSQQYGQPFEPELGMKQARILTANAVHLYRTKGTLGGIAGFVSALSGYGADVQPLKNLILDYNDSSAEESIGRWHVGVNSSIARYVADSTVDSAPDAVGIAMRNVGILQVTATATGLAQAQLGTQNPLYYGIPVVGGTSYTFSAYARSAAAGAPGVALRIFYYDAAGTYITENASAATAVSNTAWTRASFTYAAPSNAVYACLGVEWTADVAGEVTYFDAMQYEAGTAPTAFVDARLIDIYARAPRVNLVTNPNFETDTTGWDAYGATVTRDTSVFHSGTASLRHTLTGTANTYAATTVDVEPLTTYTLSLYMLAGQAAAPGAYANLSVSFVGGAAFQAQTTATLSTTDWTRLSTTFTVPDGVTQVVVVPNPEVGVGTTGNYYLIDDVLVEMGSSLRDYFDGTTYAFTGDSLWEGTANASRSHYYPQRRTRNARMNALLVDYTPMGSSYRLQYAQPL